MTNPPRGGGLDLDRFRAAKTPPGASPPEVHHVTQTPGGGSDAFSIVSRERRVKEILGSIENLPSLPAVVMKVMRLAQDTAAQASDFEDIIRKDQALAARVLKLANSPFFGLRSRVTSISQAVVVLGFKTLKSVVVAAKTSKLLNGQLVPYGFDGGGMWKHSISSATASHFLAKRAGMDADMQEELFVAGLLHDVGKIVVAPHIAKFQGEFDEALVRSGDLIRTETELVGISHAEVGSRMAQKWDLDPSLKFLIENHHRDGPTSAETRTLHVLQVADDLCNQLGIGRAGPRDPHPAFGGWVELLDFGDEAELGREVGERLDELQSIFENMAAGE